MISNTAKYAIRAMIYLSVNNDKTKKTGIKKIAKDLDIPSPFLGKILQTLAKKKILSSTKGPHGGFSINQELEDISVLKIIEIIDGLDFFNSCLLGLDCHENKKEGYQCPIHDKYEPIKKELLELFKNLTLKEMADDVEKSNTIFKL